MGSHRLLTALGIFIAGVLIFCSGPGLAADDPFPIGFIADMTGPARSFYGPEAEGFRLFVETLNDGNGINGRKIKLFMEDGQSNPARSAAIAKKLIEQDKVLAIFGLGLSTSQLPVFELAKEAKVPVVCGYTCAADVSRVDPGSTIFATGIVMNPQFHPAGYAYARIVEKFYPPTARIAISGYATPGGRIWAQWEKAILEAANYNVVYESEIPPGTIEFSAWVNKAVAAKPDVYTHAEGGEVLIPLGAALEKAGYTNDLLLPYGVIEQDVVKMRDRLMGDGQWITWASRYASAYDSSEVPEYSRIKGAMKKFGSQFDLSAEHAAGWTMGLLCEAALGKVGQPGTRGEMVAALENMNLDTRGLTGGPIRFSPTDHNGPMWWKLYRWNDSKHALVSAGDWLEIDSKDVKLPEKAK